MVSAAPRDVSNADLLRWVIDRINEHDLSALREGFWTDETVETFPDADLRGPDEIEAYFRDKYAAIDGFRLEVLAVAEDGDEVLLRWRMTGVHSGNLLGIQGTGRAIEVDGCDHFSLRDGRVVTAAVVFDQMDFARQVGLIPGDGTVPDRALKAAFNLKTRVVGAASRARRSRSR